LDSDNEEEGKGPSKNKKERKSKLSRLSGLSKLNLLGLIDLALIACELKVNKNLDSAML
jgi:hypothetical protein